MEDLRSPHGRSSVSTESWLQNCIGPIVVVAVVELLHEGGGITISRLFHVPIRVSFAPVGGPLRLLLSSISLIDIVDEADWVNGTPGSVRFDFRTPKKPVQRVFDARSRQPLLNALYT